ncbi:cold shock and DUF1294 domain-containing protein [Stenotrophomonas terrae]|uniref:cold shock and DUF1294 domain-containing protein n=1 Tax=Stenotrophomonas terrae TaxID=405446 RepID=UPI00320AB3A1
MRYQGRLQDWNDDKGYGFVLPNGGGDRAFVHIKAFEQRSQRPSNGMLINYQLRTDERGRLNAIAVRSATASKAAVAPKRAAATARLPHVSLGVGALLGLSGLWIVKLVPDWTLFTALGMSVVALGFYLHDKGAAARGQQRVPENTLHLLSLLGGWPGALIGQGLFRHKTSKQSFQFVFWLTVVLNIGAIVLIASGKIALPQ